MGVSAKKQPVKGKPYAAAKQLAGADAAAESDPGEVARKLLVPALGHYVRQGRCALFVGAGLSAGAGLPDWRTLMRHLIERSAPFALSPDELALFEDKVAAVGRKNTAGAANPLSQTELRRFFDAMLGSERSRRLFSSEGGIELLNVYAWAEALRRVRQDSQSMREQTALLEAGKYAELAGYCRELIGRRAFHDVLRQRLRAPGEIPPTHRAIVDTPYACIVTTNFDSLLEDAYVRWHASGVPKAPTGAELAQQGTLLFDERFFILKAHGDLDDEDSIVLTSEDYRRVIHSSPAFQATLGGILQRHALLFVGYSLSDVNFRLLLDNQLSIYNEQVPPRYALMEGVGEAEREILWRTARLRVMPYPKGGHHVVGQVLQALADGAATPPPPPAADAAAPAARRFMLRPQPIAQVRLDIRQSGSGLALQWHDQRSPEQPGPVWSGGCQWPDWPALRQAMRYVNERQGGSLTDLNAIGSELRNVLPEELVRRLEGIDERVPVLLELSPASETIPWEWLIVRGSALCLRHPVVRRPTGISDRSRGLRLPGDPLRALLIADSGYGSKRFSKTSLPGAQKEVQHIGELLARAGHQVTTLKGEEAVYARLMHEVENGDYDVIHFAGHAWHEDDEGVLYLWDGRVSGSELASILYRRPPALLVLNSHYTAFVPCGIFAKDGPAGHAVQAPGVDRPVPPPLGFMGLASRSGVGAFVGNFSGALEDMPASNFAIALYEQLLAGRSFAATLHAARQAATNVQDTTGMYYIGSGHAGLRLAQPPSR
jgi:SIR2-like domain/CHAT domain